MALLSIARKAGYGEVSEYMETKNFRAPYANSGSIDLTRPLSDIEKDIGKEMTELMPACIQGFNPLKEQNFAIKTESPSVAAQINRNNVIVEVNYPIEITEGDKTIRLDTFRHTIPSRFEYMREAAGKILLNSAGSPGTIDQYYLLSLAEEYNFKIDAVYTDSGEIGYIIEDEKNKLLNDEPLTFLFATKADLSEQPPIIIMDKNEFITEPGKNTTIMILAVDPNGDKIYYSSNDSHFSPDSEGIIRVSPTQANQGNTTVKVGVTDGLFLVYKEIKIIPSQ